MLQCITLTGVSSTSPPQDMRARTTVCTYAYSSKLAGNSKYVQILICCMEALWRLLGGSWIMALMNVCTHCVDECVHACIRAQGHAGMQARTHTSVHPAVDTATHHTCIKQQPWNEVVTIRRHLSSLSQTSRST